MDESLLSAVEQWMKKERTAVWLDHSHAGG